MYLAILTNIGNATRIIRHINGPRNSKDQKIVKSGASPRSKNLPALEPINAKTNPPGIIPKNVVHKKFFKPTPAIAGKILAIKKGTTGINRRSKRIFTSLTLSCSTKILNLAELFSNLLKKFLKPNLTAKLKINDYTNNAAFVIPQSIISENAMGEQYIYILKQKNQDKAVASRVIIQTGKKQGDTIEVLSGLKKGDQIIEEGARSIKDGQSVKIISF